MKKVLSVLVLTFATSVALFASVSLISKANPQLLYDNFPRFNLTLKADSEEYKNRGFYTTTQDVYYRYYNRDSFFDIGFRLDDEYFNLVFDIDLRETISSFYKRNYYSNVPYQFNILNDILDLNFPRYAYGASTLGKFYFSVGRRPISWGPATHQFAISKDVPYLDNIWVDYKTDLKNGTFDFNYVVISMNKLALQGSYDDEASGKYKTIAAHRIGFNFSSFRFSIGELNLIYNRLADLMDINPFAIYHNLYQNGSNVMAYIEVEGLFDIGNFGKLRLYGELALDDFSLSVEGEKGKPTAFGVVGGIQWHLFDGEESKTLKENSELYTLSSQTYEFKTGLNLTYEIYFCNPYIYNRETDAGKFTVPLYTDGNSSLFTPNAIYLGFKYGPNSLYQELRVDYINGKLEGSLALGILIRGDAYTINSPYGDSTVGTGVIDYNSVYKLYGNKMTTVLLTAEATYLYASGLQLEVSLEAAFDTYNEKNAVCLTIGHRIDLMVI